MTDIRLKKIYDAASNLFINMGYSRTQISHIAKAAGISVGAVYTLFSSKKAILDFILTCVLDPAFLEGDLQLPIGEEKFAGLNDAVMSAFDACGKQFASPLFDEAANYSYEQMLSDAFDIVFRYSTGCLLFEKNPNDCGPLGQFYRQYREQFFDTFSQYIALFTAQQTIRALDYPAYSTMLMIETIAWWAMHVRHDAFETKPDIPIEAAKNVCLDALIRAYQTP